MKGKRRLAASGEQAGAGPMPASVAAGYPLTGGIGRLDAGRRRQRRQSLLLGAMLMLAGAGGALYLASAGDGRVEVIALSHPVSRGDVLTPDDLATVDVAVDGGHARMLSPSAATAVVGKAALIDLPAGTFVTPELVSAATPPLGNATVGIRVAADALPAAKLRAGELVRIVRTDPGNGDAQRVVDTASVVSVAAADRDGNGDVIVYVAVPTDAADDLAGAASVRGGVRLLGVAP